MSSNEVIQRSQLVTLFSDVTKWRHTDVIQMTSFRTLNESHSEKASNEVIQRSLLILSLDVVI